MCALYVFKHACMHASLKICTLMQAYLLLTHGFVFIYAISCYCAEKNGSWRAITVQKKDVVSLTTNKVHQMMVFTYFHMAISNDLICNSREIMGNYAYVIPTPAKTIVYHYHEARASHVTWSIEIN